MLRSLFTGIAGLQAHQNMLDVTSNNIANVNTTGFKSSSTVFEDTLSQTITGGGAPSAQLGGTNATQVGLGVQLAATNLNFTQGSNQATGVASNMLINGDGFFTVAKDGKDFFTRAGAFTIDSQGHLVSPDGGIVQGWLLDATGNSVNGAAATAADVDTPPGVPSTLNAAGTAYTDPADAGANPPKSLELTSLNNGTYVSYSISPDGTVNGVDAAGATTAIAKISLSTFTNPNGLSKSGDSDYLPTASSGQPILGTAGTGGLGTITSGYIEMSNVNLAQELTNLIISERGFQANSKVITTSDDILQTLVNLKQ
ncbi:MAG TPA: flagellar hook-basal body complex protein [Jatrophihabitans sp.]|jgi:flagellar hook protein FlgE